MKPPILKRRTKMVRMQIQLTDQQSSLLRHEAAARGTSVAALVRVAFDRALKRPARGASLEERKRRAIAAAGRFHSGLGDVSARHDDYFADSIEE
jgi:post-segregation antitoxin (ccd killing protein)